MTAENIYSIAIHLPEKELEKLYIMLDKKVNMLTSFKKPKRKLITDKEAVDFLLKNVFSK
ncbi:hypothetical protein [Flavobacterium sp.]|uniref:hypothetical protein n=1 Tax=Flavobacterium sp. TaxID=239 RepID=UPI0026333A18|nr:hypothetical protein [Flavobacterium sp.]